MRLNFEKVEIKSVKGGHCAACGRPAQRSKKFWQTINPFNTVEGQPTVKKGREKILSELRVQSEAWKSEPIYHAKCEG